jgi:hypothetical protein
MVALGEVCKAGSSIRQGTFSCWLLFFFTVVSSDHPFSSSLDCLFLYSLFGLGGRIYTTACRRCQAGQLLKDSSKLSTSTVVHVVEQPWWLGFGSLSILSGCLFLIRLVKSSLLLSSGVNSKSLSAPLCQSIIFRATHSIIMAPLLPKAFSLCRQTTSVAPSSKSCLLHRQLQPTVKHYKR